MLNAAQEIIFDRYKNPQFSGSVQNATVEGDGANPLCGDEVHIEARVTDGVIAEIRHTSRACAVCTASADLLAEELTGKPFTHVLEITTAEIQESLGIPLSPLRLKCALLPLETLKTLTSAS